MAHGCCGRQFIFFVFLVIIFVDRLPDDSIGEHEVFLSDNEEKCLLQQESEETEALVKIGGLLIDTVQILHECQSDRRQQTGAKQKLFSLRCFAFVLQEVLLFG